MIDYLLMPEIPIDTAHTLDQLTVRFGSLRDGLPELVKNSKDQYARLGVLDKTARQIGVLANTDKRLLGVLDFAGASSNDFSGWTTWSSRTAGKKELAKDIEAGHGNGGKAFMVRGATTVAYLESCYKSRRTRMGFRNDRPIDRYKPGYGRIDGVLLNDALEPDPAKHLTIFLHQFGMSISDLPQSAQQTFSQRRAFSGVYLERVRDWEGRRRATIRRSAEDLPSSLALHGQTALTIETCSVWVSVDGRLITEGAIIPAKLEPYPGFEEPEVIPIPDVLPDPETRENISTGAGTPSGKYLRLMTSKKHLQLSDELKARNVIRIWNARNNVATWTLPELGILLPSVSFIYGELRCPGLSEEHLTGAERIHLSNTPLTRALEVWARGAVKALADLIHRAQLAETKPKDREQAATTLRLLRDLMRKYLDPEGAIGDESDNDDLGSRGDTGPGRKKGRTREKFGSRVDRTILEPGQIRLSTALGTKIPLVYRCFEIQEDGALAPVRCRDIRLKCTPPELAALSDGGFLEARAVGRGQMWLESTTTNLTSNAVELEVLRTTGVDILVPDEPLLQGQRAKLKVFFRTDSGLLDDLFIEGSIDEPEMGLIGRLGRFTAGLREGVATVRVRFGPNDGDHATEAISIGPNRVPPSGSGGAEGSDIAEILLCGEEAPGMDEYPKEQRTHGGREQFPTIIEEPQFRDIVWINTNSKESIRVRRSRGGPAGIGGISTQTFMHFVALKCFEVLKRLWVRQHLRGRSVTETEFIQAAALAETECADFIDVAWELSDRLVDRQSGG